MHPGMKNKIQGVDMRKPLVPGYSDIFELAFIVVFADKARLDIIGITTSSSR